MDCLVFEVLLVLCIFLNLMVCVLLYVCLEKVQYMVCGLAPFVV